jgi:hypothetical protein
MASPLLGGIRPAHAARRRLDSGLLECRRLLQAVLSFSFPRCLSNRVHLPASPAGRPPVQPLPPVLTRKRSTAAARLHS